MYLVLSGRMFAVLLCIYLAVELMDHMVTFFFLFYLFIFGEREREGEREGEKNQCVVASCAPPTGDPAHNPGVCPEWESNQGPFGLQARTQSPEPHQPGHK